MGASLRSRVGKGSCAFMHAIRLWVLQFCVVVLAAAGSRAAPGSFFAPVQPVRPFQFMAHRGESHRAPENGRAALQGCIEDVLEWAEVDVRRTRDGRHILSHADSVVAGSNGVWRIAEHTFEELETVDIGTPFAARFRQERLLSLEEAFSLAKGRLNLCLDCKAVDPAQLAREILAAGMESQVVVYDNLAGVRAVGAAGQGRIPLMTKWHAALGPVEWAVTNGLSAVEIDALEITPAICAAFHQAGIKVEAKVLGEWDRAPFWDQAVSGGADWLQTDLPEELMAHTLWQRIKTRPVQFSLHRGANRYTPENTLPGFDKAIRMGADYIEFDVRTTSDGKLFLLHDGKLDGRTTGTGQIAEVPSNVVATLSAGEKFSREYTKIPLPTLDEFLGDVAGKVGLYFDAKAIDPKTLAAALDKYGVLERTVVYGSPSFLARVKEANPKIKLLPPLYSPAAIEAMARELQPYAFDTEWNLLSPELIAKCHGLGIKVFSDALGDHEKIEEYQKVMDWGIDLIQTDHPLRLFRAIELRQGR